ncbi:MAG: hypothetical protein HYV02_06905 [Deltaproteobacteria bacterium]|nr:hypothetical protein [Deltaproteobacteria bacterium]
MRSSLSCLTSFIIAIMFAACGSSNTGSTTVTTPTATITAADGLTAFSYRGGTAYYADFGDTGVGISGATSATVEGAPVASYAWEQISGVPVTITSGRSGDTLIFDIPAMTAILHASDEYRWQVLGISRNDAQLEFRLTVTDADGNGDVGTYTVHLFDNGAEVKTSSGIPNVGVGEKVYLSGPSLKANTNTTSSTVTDWSWTLTQPSTSTATFTDSSTTTSARQIPSFVPDIAGTYTVAYVSPSSGQSGTLTINAANYVGVGTIADASADSSIGQCGNCHVDNELTWEETGHAVQFEQAIGSYAAKAPEPYCWECHTVGFNTESAATNAGFDDLVDEAGYAFPSTGTTWPAFTENNPTLTPLTNIQCENCHGPGKAHMGITIDSRIAYQTWNAGVCGKCHPQEAEWKISAHNSTGVTTAGRYQLSSWWGAACARCHSTGGFIQHAAGATVTAQETHDFLVTCVACHDPHSQAGDTVSGSTAISGNDSTQLRLKGVVTLKDDAGTQVDAGAAAVCYTCHDGFYVEGEEDCDTNGDGTADAVCETVDQVATQYFRQVHGNPQAFVLEGVGVVTAFSDSAYNVTLTENSFHTSSYFTLKRGTGDVTQSDENNKCVTCHMGTTPTAEETGYRLVGGHTWRLANGGTQFLSACTACHPGLTTFNRTARADYDGDGSVEGIQDEIKGLLLALSTKILSTDSTNISGGTTADADGVITVGHLSFSNQTKMNASTIDVRRAVYNHNVISKDGSLGVHNAAFAIQVLQKTYASISQLNGGNGFSADYPNATLR